ncbi:hypothetical protein BDR26DRAFT_942373 [Obelidium mucronatum]|nr:hypothetical protein BDR26DRAFT_942373 [Obelidium mucronatum]
MPPRTTRSSSPSRLVPAPSSSAPNKEPELVHQELRTMDNTAIGATLIGALADAEEVEEAATSVGLVVTIPNCLTVANSSSKEPVTAEQTTALELMKNQLFQTLLSTYRIPYTASEAGVYQVAPTTPLQSATGDFLLGARPPGAIQPAPPTTTPTGTTRTPAPKLKQPAVKLVKPLATILAVEEEAYTLFQESGSWCAPDGRVNRDLLRKASCAEVVRFLERKAKEEAGSLPANTSWPEKPLPTSQNHSVHSTVDYGQHLFESDFAEPMARNTVREMQKAFYGSATFTSPVPPGYAYPVEYSCFETATKILAFVEQTNQAVSRHLSRDALLVSNWCNLSYSLKCLTGFKDLSPHAASYELLTQLKIVSSEAEERASAALRMNAALKEQAKRITALSVVRNAQEPGLGPAAPPHQPAPSSVEALLLQFLTAQSRGGRPSFRRGRGGGRGGRPKPAVGEPRTCHKCKKVGHIAVNCTEKRREYRGTMSIKSPSDITLRDISYVIEDRSPSLQALPAAILLQILQWLGFRKTLEGISGSSPGRFPQLSRASKRLWGISQDPQGPHYLWAPSPEPQYSLHQRMEDLHCNPARSHQAPLDQVFTDSSRFVAGQVNSSKLKFWEWASNSYPERKAKILGWVREGVDVTKYMRHFRGSTWDHKGAKTHWDSSSPPQRHLENHPFKQHREFAFRQICEEIANGTRLVVGRWEDVKNDPGQCPWIISPLGVEPSKPRLFDNCTFLNQWFPSIPFKLPSPAVTATWEAVGAAITDLNFCGPVIRR